MVKDPERKRTATRPTTGPKQGGSDGILAVLLSLVMKNPKLILPILIIGGIVLLFNGGGLSGLLSSDSASMEQLFSLGCDMDPAIYDQAYAFEPLSDDPRNRLPERVSLADYAPTRLNQGRQGSCVGWASAYGARTILYARETGKEPDAVAFSPAYLYNQIALEGCQGSYLYEAMEKMRTTGGLLLKEYPYSESSCANAPQGQDLQRGRNYVTKGYERLTVDGNNHQVNLASIRQNLAQGAPVVIGMMVGGTFLQEMVGKDVWIPSQRDYSMAGYGGHAMCVIGYDDLKEGGAFQIMNSWGKEWGRNGIAWVRYADFEHFTREAYGLHPMGSSEKFDPDRLEAEIGLVRSEDGQRLPLRKVSGNIYRTVNKINAGTAFKAEVSNSIECNIYVFGEEVDGSTYVLFPYTEKHSPYCGITGTRIFPRDYSMVPDKTGSRDRIVVVLAKEAIDFTALNGQFNASGGELAGRVEQVLQPQLARDIRVAGTETAQVAARLGGRNAVAVVIEIDK